MQDVSISPVSAPRGADAQLREELVAYLRPTVCMTVPYVHGDAICGVELTGKGQRQNLPSNSGCARSDLAGTTSGVVEEKENRGGS